MATSGPRTPRTPNRNSFSIPGTPSSYSPVSSDAGVPEQLQHLATQIVTQTVSNRAQLKTFAEQLNQMAQKQDEALGIVRAEESRCVFLLATGHAVTLSDRHCLCPAKLPECF